MGKDERVWGGTQDHTKNFLHTVKGYLIKEALDLSSVVQRGRKGFIVIRRKSFLKIRSGCSYR